MTSSTCSDGNRNKETKLSQHRNHGPLGSLGTVGLLVARRKGTKGINKTKKVKILVSPARARARGDAGSLFRRESRWSGR